MKFESPAERQKWVRIFTEALETETQEAFVQNAPFDPEHVVAIARAADEQTREAMTIHRRRKNELEAIAGALTGYEALSTVPDRVRKLMDERNRLWAIVNAMETAAEELRK